MQLSYWVRCEEAPVAMVGVHLLCGEGRSVACCSRASSYYYFPAVPPLSSSMVRWLHAPQGLNEGSQCIQYPRGVVRLCRDGPVLLAEHRLVQLTLQVRSSIALCFPLRLVLQHGVMRCLDEREVQYHAEVVWLLFEPIDFE